MTRNNITFSDIDKKIMESYKGTVAGLADYLGSGYELVLHSLADLDHSVIAIFNGHYTGRKVGSPVTDLALQMLSRLEEQTGGDYITYFARNKNDQPLKCTTTVIRGEYGRAIGLLCINFYLNTPFQSLLKDFTTKDSQPNPDDHLSEAFVNNTGDLIDSTLEAARNSVMRDSTVSASNKNKEIVTILYEKGIFNLKDAVITVAEKLGISRNTVYMHLRNLNGK